MKIFPRIKHTELNPVTLSPEEFGFSLILLNLEHGGSKNAFINSHAGSSERVSKSKPNLLSYLSMEYEL